MADPGQRPDILLNEAIRLGPAYLRATGRIDIAVRDAAGDVYCVDTRMKAPQPPANLSDARQPNPARSARSLSAITRAAGQIEDVLGIAAHTLFEPRKKEGR